MTEKQLAMAFMEIFPGLDRAYGVYNIADVEVAQGEKVKGATIRTKHAKYSVRNWIAHLEGTTGLGIVPIDSKNQVQWAVIDVDRYDMEFDYLITKLGDLPLVPMRSKSGGLHIFVFFVKPVSAGSAQKALKQIAASLGFGGSEVFPKQTRLHDTKDVGQWLNMPYFNHTDTKRYAYTPNGEALDAQDFIALVHKKRTTLQALGKLSLDEDYSADSDIPGGPPCLEYLIAHGFPPGSRNHGLFNLGVYYRKAFPDDWKDKVEEANQKWMGPGTSEEVQMIVRSLDKKSYTYRCTDLPLCKHCNKDLCHTRKFGVGEQEDLPTYSGLTLLQGNPPLYYINVNDVRVGPLEANDLIKQDNMILAVFQKGKVLVNKVPQKRWAAILTKVMEECTEVEMPSDSDMEQELFEFLGMYCLSKDSTVNKDELLNERVWENEDEDTYWFKLRNFREYLRVIHRHTEISQPKIAAIFHEAGMKNRYIKVKGKGFNIWIFAGVEKPGTVSITVEETEENF